MKKILISLFIIGLAGVGFFFRDQLFSDSQKTLVIGLNTEATDLSAYGLDANNATRTANIYEGLVAFDKDLRLVPALAVSWGNLSDTAWEFRLRQGVSYHDGSLFQAQDVVDAFDAAQNSQNPNILPYLNTIKSIEAIDASKILIETTEPDPLLLSKLTKLKVFKADRVGTGPYRFKNWEAGQHVELEAFGDYWGAQPHFKHLIYSVQTNRAERNRAFEAGEIQLLTAVSPDQAINLPAERLKTIYGLEVNFLMFKLQESPFSEMEIREALQKLFDPEEIKRIGNGFVQPASQFVASGVFGYHQALNVPDYDASQEPRDLFGVRLEPIVLDYPETYQTLSEYLTGQLQKAGFSVQARGLQGEGLLEEIKQNKADLYLLGWQFEDGDAGSFFDTFIHSEGVLNQGRYRNLLVDEWIEASRREMNPQKRLELLRKIGEQIQIDLIGIPLFETSRLYALQDDIEWEPRLDGLVLGVEVR